MLISEELARHSTNHKLVGQLLVQRISLHGLERTERVPIECLLTVEVLGRWLVRLAFNLCEMSEQ